MADEGLDGAIQDLDKEEFGLEDKVNYPMILMVAMFDMNKKRATVKEHPDFVRPYINSVIAFSQTAVLAMKDGEDKKKAIGEIVFLQSLNWGNKRIWWVEGMKRADKLRMDVCAKVDHVFLKKTKIVDWD